MSARYWVGGSGSWLDPTKWSQTSGGMGGWPPGSANWVVFDSNSSPGSYTVTDMPTTLTNAGIFIFPPATGSVTFATYSTQFIIAGSYVIAPGVTVPSGRNVTFNPSGTGNVSFRTNGITHGNVVVSATSGSPDIIQLDALTCSSLTLNQGGWETDNFALTTTGNFTVQPPPGSFVLLVLGSSSVTVGGVLDFSSVLGSLSFVAGTSTIYLNRNSSDYSLKASGQTFNTIWKENSNGRFSGSFTANTVFFRNTQLTFDGPMTVAAQNLAVAGIFNQPYNIRNSLRTTSPTNNVTFTASTTCSFTSTSFEGVTYSGVVPNTTQSLGDLGGNVGLSAYLDAPQNCYWVPTADNQGAGSNYWSSTSGGAINTLLYPLPQHTLVYDDNSAFKLTFSNLPFLGNLNTVSRTVSGEVRLTGATSIFGNLQFGATVYSFSVTSSSMTFANKYVAQSISSATLNQSVLASSTTTTIDKASRTLSILCPTALGRVSHLSGTVSSSQNLQAQTYTLSSGATLAATGRLALTGVAGTVWTADIGAIYQPGTTGYIWAYFGSSGINLTLNLGNLSYNKIAVNQPNTITLNVANSPYIGLLTNQGDFPYAIPTNVTLTGAGVLTLGQWQLNGTSTAARQTVTGSGGAQIKTTSYYPIQASFVSLTNVAAQLPNQFYASGSLDNGGNTNWTFGTAPPRSSGFMMFF